MAKTESVLFKLGADVSGLTKGLAQGRAGLKDVENSANSLTNKLVGLAGVLGAGIGFAAASAEALRFADSVDHIAKQTHISTDAVQRLAFFASQTGNTLEQVTTAIGKMQENLVKAADGTEKQADAFAKLGINTETFFRLNPDEQLQQVAEGLAAIKNPADQAATAVAVLGKTGKDDIPLLLDMANKAGELNAQFERMGGPMSAETIAKLDGIGDAASTTGQSVRNFAGEILALASPAIIGAMQGITDFFAGLRHGIGGGERNAISDIDDQITDVEQRIARGPGFRQPAEAWVANKKALEEELAMLHAKQAAVMAANDAEAMAKFDASKRAAPQAEELQDIVVHEAAKREARLTGEQATQLAIIELDQAYHQQVEEAVRKHEENKTEIERGEAQKRYDFQQMTLDNQVSLVADKLIAMTAATAQHSRAMFEINKVASIAKATIDGYEAVQSSYKFGASIGGPVVGAAFAAVAVAATAANISAIAKTQFNGGGKGVSPNNATQAPIPVTQAGGGGGGGNGQTLRVEGLSGDQFFTAGTVRTLAGKLLEFQKDGGQVLLP